MPLSQVNVDNYQQQLDAKVSRISQLFADINPPSIEVFNSQPLHFRMRAEFKIWHEGDDSFYAMFKKEQPKTPYRIDQFPIGSQSINRIMPALMAQIKQSHILRNRLFQVEFLTTLSNQALVTLIYHKTLGQEWQEQAQILQQQLAINIIGRSKKQRLVLNHDYVIETLNINEETFSFQQVENSFTQPNANVNQKMLTWAMEHSKHNAGDLVELYCGNGNFTAVLSKNFNRVLATEISKVSVKSAQYNFRLNTVNNVDIVRMSSEEFSAALQGQREFRRLKDINLNAFNFTTILVDPPRAGLDSKTEQLVSQFDHIIYISCNPYTLHDNLQHICKTHQMKQFALFDQFPYTDHIECGVILAKNNVLGEN